MRVHALTLAYAPARVLEAGLDRFYATRTPSLPLTHYLIDQHYPLEAPETRAAALSAALKHGMTYLDPGKNLGLHQGLNWACEQIKPAQGDIILVYDPDSWPNMPGWDLAIAAGMTVGKFEILGLLDPRSRAELVTRGVKVEHIVDGYLQIYQPVTAGVISVAGYAWDFLRAVGGFSEVMNYYGGLEASMWGKLGLYGGRWGYLMQYDESLRLQKIQDPEFEAYKHAHARDRVFDGTFEQWLSERAGSK